MNWFVLVILSAITFSISQVLQRVLLKDKEHDPLASAVVFQLMAGAVCFLFAVLTGGFQLPNLQPFVFNLTLMTVLYAALNLILFKAFQLAPASEVTIIFSSRIIWTMIFAAIFLGERLTVIQIAGGLLVLAGIAIASYQQKALQLNKGIVFSLIAAVTIAAAFTNDAFVLNSFDAPSYLTIAFIFPALFLLVIKPGAIHHLPALIQPKALLKMSSASIFYAISAITVFLAYQVGGQASQLVPISNLSVILTVALAFIFLRERENFSKKMLGAAVVIAGVILLR